MRFGYPLRLPAILTILVLGYPPMTMAQLDSRRSGVSRVRYLVGETEKPAALTDFVLSDACTGKILFHMGERNSPLLHKADWKRGEVQLKLSAGSYYAEVRTNKVTQKDLLHLTDSLVAWGGEWVFHLYSDKWPLPRGESSPGGPGDTADSLRLSYYEQDSQEAVRLDDFAVVDACAKRLLLRKGILEPADLAEVRWETGKVTLFLPPGIYEIHALADGYEPTSSPLDIRPGESSGREMGFSMVREGWGKGAQPWKELRPDRVVITGTIFDEETGRPLKGVTVQQSQGKASTVTDTRGEFTLVLNVQEGNGRPANAAVAGIHVAIKVSSSLYEKAEASFTVPLGGYRVQNFRLIRARAAVSK
jgi:hypothetical protein